MKVSLTSITDIEASLGRKRSWLRGLVAGGIAGLLIGLSTKVDPNNCGVDDDYFCSRGEAAVAFTVVTAGMGAGIGLLFKSERWTSVTVNVTAQPVYAGPGGLGLAVAVRFRERAAANEKEP